MAMLAAEGKTRVPGLLDGLVPGRLKLRKTSADPEPIPLSEAKHLSDDYFVHGHVPYRSLNMNVITILRDPRNVLLSFMRKTDTPFELALEKFVRRPSVERPFVEVYRSFLDWPDVVVYEDLDFVESPDLYANSKQDNSTWTGDPSDWEQCWTDEYQRLWEDAGGEELLEDAGYD